MSESIKVLVRIRPLSISEKERGCKSIVKVDQEANQINITKPDEADNLKSFAYDSVFTEASEQALVYSKAAYALVQHVLEGYNGTVFAYGQTGCGKTHSMVGVPENQELQGIIPRCFGQTLKTISQASQKEFLLRCSFLEIYNQEIHDLLGDPKAKLQLKQSPEKGVFVKDLSMKQAQTHQQLMDYLVHGNKNRAVGQTAMNKDSSRSHLLFALHLESASGEGPERRYVASRLNLVDLAGSERLSKTGASGDRLKQAQKINLSLSALGNVISALVEGRSQHIPYRDSKLTRLLQDSLGGNTKTVMLANCSPADYNYEQTLSTLRYASRAKMIKNKPVINEDPKDALLKQYANQIQKLKRQLQGNVISVGEDIPDLHYKLKEKEAELQNQKNQKNNLMRRIQQLQSHHIQAKNVSVDPRVLENVKRVSMLMEHQKAIKQKCSILLEDQQKQQINIKNQKGSEDEVMTKKEENKLIKTLRMKIGQLEKQVRDVGHESYLQKECLLQDIRFLTKQNKFIDKVISMLLQNHQLQQIREASQYNEEKDQYKVPPFYIKNKELVFPKLQQQQSMDMIKQMMEGRLIHMESDKENKQNSKEIIVRDNKKRKSRDLGLSDILKEARGGDSGGLKTLHEEKKVRKIMLDPILKI